jgi:hypothetical protein
MKTLFDLSGNERDLFERSSKAKKRKKRSRDEKIRDFCMGCAKRYFKSAVKSLIENAYAKKYGNSGSGGKNISLRCKWKRLKFLEDEVELTGCFTIDEIRGRYLFLGLGDVNDWGLLVATWYNDALSAIGQPEIEGDSGDYDLYNSDYDPFQELRVQIDAQRRFGRMKKNFSGFRF